MKKPLPWTRLSETLPFEAQPDRCQSCGQTSLECRALLHIWTEHDDRDQPERRFICLCARCSDKLIEPHPRLYSDLPDNTPAPGTMALCIQCVHRKGLNCTSRLAKFNGGPGINVTVAKPMVVHMDGTKGGKRWSRWLNHYSTPPTACTGRTLK